MKIIDLSMTIQPHWRWPLEPTLHQDLAKGDVMQHTVLPKLGMHAFTHVDTPQHILPGQIRIHEVPPEDWAGPAAVADLSHVRANREIGLDDLKTALPHLRKNDIVILKSAWDLKRDYTSREYWTEAPYVNDEAAVWLSNLPIKAVGFDFPQDYVIREVHRRRPSMDELTTHKHILGRGIYLVEYLCNVHSIPGDRTMFFALPLKVKDAEGAPCRAFAVSDY